MNQLGMDGLVRRPSKAKPTTQACIGNTVCARGFSQRHRTTMHRQSCVASRVVGLSYAGSPAAVTDTVWAVWVDSVKGLMRLARPHVSEELRERIPRSGHPDATTAIVMEPWIVRVVTSLTRRRPRRVFARRFRWLGVTVDEMATRPATAATLGISRAEGISLHAGVLSAVASTDPYRAGRSRIATNHNETTESLPCQVH